MTKNKTITLPKTFKQKDLDFITGGKGNKDYEKYLGLPKISYSDINLFLNETYSSNSLRDYVLQQFLRVPSKIHESYGEFGKATEAYICNKNNTWGFTPEEKETLDKIQPLGEFQQGFVLNFGQFLVVGLQDDICENIKICEKTCITDYKTASQGSYEKQYKDSKDSFQLKIYALNWLENKGIIPDLMRWVIIEREGNPYSKIESERKLTVGKNIWVKEFTTNEKELLELKEKIIKVVNEISEYYRIFTLLNK